MEIRKATLDDVPAIKRCVDACAGPLYYTADTDERWLYDNLADNGVCYVAVDKNLVLGYCVLIDRVRVWDTASKLGMSGINQMETMGVNTFFRKGGIAKQLMSRCCECITTKKTLATVHPDNIGSKKVLEFCGFKHFQTTKLYEGQPREIWIKIKD